MPAECEIESCGVVAVGRCRVCGRAFCPSHQGHEARADGTTATAVDVCSACQTTPESRGEASTPEARLAMVRARLIEAGVPLERRFKYFTAGRTLFGAQKTTWEELEPAWFVGDLEWDQPKTRKQGEIGTHASGVTADGQIVAMGDPLGSGVFEGPPTVDRCRALPAELLAALERVATRAGVEVDAG